MPFGPHTVEHSGLGGSETAQWAAGEALRDLGHEVTQFTAGQGVGRVWRNVTWNDVKILPDVEIDCDLMIVCRRPDLIDPERHRAKWRVLWVQDFACPWSPWRYPDEDALENFDEIWFVSEWQREQWRREIAHRMVGKYPRTYVTRNGIVPQSLYCADIGVSHRNPQKLAFVSRPERGLLPLVMPGGIMDHLPEYTLHVCGYADFPENNRAFYDTVFGHARSNPRVVLHGSLPNVQVRALLATSAAMLLPTNYAETSCMSALEAIEVLTPVLGTPTKHDMTTTGSGALEETVRGAGRMIHVFGAEYGSAAWCESWARQARRILTDDDEIRKMRIAALRRNDYRWDGIVREWTAHAEHQIRENELL